MSVWSSKETHVELNVDKQDQNNNDTNHWATRTIARRLIELTNDELSQFLETVGISTFAFLKSDQKDLCVTILWS